MTEEALRPRAERGADVIAAARARHAAMSPARRALADVGADASRLVVVAPTHEVADRAMSRAGVPRPMWRHAYGPDAMRGHAPGTPLLWIDAPLSVDGPGRAAEMRAMIAPKGFVPVDIADVAAILGDG